MCTSFLHENARICARRTTDRDLVIVIPDKKERKGEKEKHAHLYPLFFLSGLIFLINKSGKNFSRFFEKKTKWFLN